MEICVTGTALSCYDTIRVIYVLDCVKGAIILFGSSAVRPSGWTIFDFNIRDRKHYLLLTTQSVFSFNSFLIRRMELCCFCQGEQPFQILFPGIRRVFAGPFKTNPACQLVLKQISQGTSKTRLIPEGWPKVLLQAPSEQSQQHQPPRLRRYRAELSCYRMLYP